VCVCALIDDQSGIPCLMIARLVLVGIMGMVMMLMTQTEAQLVQQSALERPNHRCPHQPPISVRACSHELIEAVRRSMHSPGGQ